MEHVLQVLVWLIISTCPCPSAVLVNVSIPKNLEFNSVEILDYGEVLPEQSWDHHASCRQDQTLCNHRIQSRVCTIDCPWERMRGPLGKLLSLLVSYFSKFLLDELFWGTGFLVWQHENRQSFHLQKKYQEPKFVWCNQPLPLTALLHSKTNLLTWKKSSIFAVCFFFDLSHFVSCLWLLEYGIKIFSTLYTKTSWPLFSLKSQCILKQLIDTNCALMFYVNHDNSHELQNNSS